MQLSLFDSGDESQCRHPNHAGTTGYKYGCRCPRCVQARQRQNHPSMHCAHEGCTTQRRKHRRWCTEHIPPPMPSKIRSEAACELCSRTHSWYESQLASTCRPELRDLYRRTCANCRRLYIGAVRSHHLDTAWAIRLIMATHCELCGERFARARNHRLHKVVDHDHGCCPHTASCGRCMRGILCPRCNGDVASYEQIVIHLGTDKIDAYLAQTMHR